jgi:hypothetical protein
MKPLYLSPHRIAALACAVAAVLLQGCGAAPGSSFNWEITPGNQQTVAPGGQMVYTITIQSKENINSRVFLRVEGVPPNATATFDQQTLPDTATQATLTVQTAASTPVGTYTLTIFAQEEGRTEVSNSRTLFVASSGGGPDFSLDLTPTEHTFTAGGGSPTISYYLNPLNGFSGNVNVSVSGLTDDLTITQGPSPPTVGLNVDGHAGAGGTFVLSYAPVGAVQSPVDVVVTATNGTITHTRTLHLTLPGGGTGPGGDFTVDVTPNPANVFLGISRTFTVTVTPTGGFTGNVDLTYSGQPNGLVTAWQGASSVAVGPNPGTATLYVMPDSPNLPQTMTLTITGTSGTITKTKTLTLNFSLG